MTQIKKHQLAFIDTETTGLNTEMHELIEIGVVLVSQEWQGTTPVFKVVEEFEVKIIPEHIENADPVALKVNGYDPKDWIGAIPLADAMELFAKKTEDAIMIAHNVTFDSAFIDKAFKKTGVINKMHYHRLDTISMAFAKLHLDEIVDKYSLRFLCEYFKIENTREHSALPDARATFELYKKVLAL